MVAKTKMTKKRSGRQAKKTTIPIIDYFIACPRCSFFLAGYRLLEQDFDEAMANASTDWLDLTWNPAVRNLVRKSYGCEIDEDLQVFQGVCPECRRAFVFATGEEEGDADQFSVQINPRS